MFKPHKSKRTRRTARQCMLRIAARLGFRIISYSIFPGLVGHSHSVKDFLAVSTRCAKEFVTVCNRNVGDCGRRWVVARIVNRPRARPYKSRDRACCGYLWVVVFMRLKIVKVLHLQCNTLELARLQTMATTTHNHPQIDDDASNRMFVSWCTLTSKPPPTTTHNHPRPDFIQWCMFVQYCMLVQYAACSSQPGCCGQPRPPTLNITQRADGRFGFEGGGVGPSGWA